MEQKSESNDTVVGRQLEGIKAAVGFLESNAASIVRDASIQHQCEKLGTRLCQIASSHSDSNALSSDIERDDPAEEMRVKEEKNAIIGRIYNLVGSAMIDSQGRLCFAIDPSTPVDAEKHRSLDNVVQDVSAGERLPMHSKGSHEVSSAFNRDDIYAIRDAINIYSEGQLHMLPEARFLSAQVIDQVPPLNPNAG